MLFKDIIAQDEVKKHLMTSVSAGIIPHAQMFCGPVGVGKLQLAVAYAQYLNCENRQDADSCDECASCRKYKNRIHPDLHFVFPIVKKDKKEICDDYLTEWRAFCAENAYFSLGQWLSNLGAENAQGLIYAKESEEIMRKLTLKSYEAKYKVMIIWQPEKMHEACANKLLKIIEEPFDKTIFLLVSDAPEMVLQTIQSRCQRINMASLPKEEIVQALRNSYNISAEDAQTVAHIANGSYLKAVETISFDEENKFFFNLYVQMMRSSYQRSIKDIKNIATEIGGVGREKQKNYLKYCQRMIREYFINNLSQSEMVYLNADEANFGVRFSPFINDRNIEDFTEELALAERHIEQNANAKMVFFDLGLKITMLIKR